ncbi:MAG: PSD1 and planctomycete cytochrome C domain-containing protein [Planctomycetaceae bacterium]
MVAVAVLAGQAIAAEADAVSFNRDIRPILSEHCFACHGPDAAKRAADLRLDVRDGATADLGGHAAIVPGAADRSEAIRRVLASDPDEVMPPPETKKSLTPAQIDLLRRWIDSGAAYQGHWAYEPLERPEVPAGDDGGPRNPIDRFIDRELARHALAPVGQADPATLVRRLHLDLTGLPPTPADIDAFIADTAPDAWERLVDRLLASPHHAERMAQWWLDLARYADTVGFHGDQPMSVWPYRDWVIKAFRDNMPFDRFTREQLGGDLVPDATQENRLAAVYNRLALMSAEGGGQEKEYLAKYAADRVRGVSGAWLGSTVGCAECHDHKYDPFTTRDFYALAAFFADIQEKGIYDGGAPPDKIWGQMERFFSPEDAARIADVDRRLADVRKAFEAETPELIRAREQWIASQAALPAFQRLVPVTMASARDAKLVAAADGLVKAEGPAPEADDVTLVFDLPPGPLGAIRLEALADKQLPSGGPGRAANGNFVVTEVIAALRPVAASNSPESLPDDTPIRLVHAAADFEQAVAGEFTPSGKWLAAYTIDGDASGRTVGWAVHERVGNDHWLVVRPAEPIDVPAGTRMVFSIAQHHGKGFTLGGFRVSVAATPADTGASSELPKTLAAAIATPPAQRTPEQTATLAAHYRSIAPELQFAPDAIAALERERAAMVNDAPAVPVTVAGPPRTTRILPRGNWMDESGAVVEPAPPGFLPQPSAADRRLTRLDLADWLVSRENPLVPRVLVNRLWAIGFGQGISRRLDDHGSQGEPPSHPDLLDWLACELRDGGTGSGPWDVRHTLRLIVTSEAYRRSSAAPREIVERDPDNRLLARQNRFRVEAENVRDTLLAVSGLLVPTIGGPSVKPYQPEGYWDYLNFPKRTYAADTGDKLYRRGLYTWWQRQYLHPAMLVFDAPSREECTARRPRSNTPLQALVLLNDPAAVEAARALAAKAIGEAGADPHNRGRFLLRRAIGRVPADAEVDVIVQLAESQRAALAADGDAVKRFLEVGAFVPPAPVGADPVDLAAWTAAARAVLALQETTSRH